MSAGDFRVDTLPHLRAAMDFTGRGGNGACVQWAAALCLDLRLGLLTFGTVRASTPEEAAEIGPSASPVPFIHAWVEGGPVLYAPTTIPRTDGVLVAMKRDGYYALNGVTDVRRLPRLRFEAIARRWALSSALRHGRQRAGRGDLADELLTAAGVRYVLHGPNRALLPAGVSA